MKNDGRRNIFGYEESFGYIKYAYGMSRQYLKL